MNNECAPATDMAFVNIIKAHKAGTAITALSTALKQLTAAVQLTSKPGSVTLVMKIAPASKGDASTVVFLAKVKAQIPEPDAPGSIFYADEDFNLVREDPNQTEMQLTQVPAEVKSAPVPVPEAKAAAVPVPEKAIKTRSNER